jgi:hypothetical protein
MRRILATSLMMMFSWMLIAPFFAPDADATLPSCCRRNGKHHCMVRTMEDLSGRQRGVTNVSEKCPYFPVSSVAVHAPTYSPGNAEAFFAEVLSHPALAPQAEALQRISFTRSRQKRGPPPIGII